MTYKATIYFDAYEDVYKTGESESCDNAWREIVEAESAGEMRASIEQATYSKWSDIEHEDSNEYPTQSEYWTGYMADADNQGEAYASDVEKWKQGNMRLWAIHCHILVSKITETKVTL